jgi:hypothetical protein
VSDRGDFSRLPAGDGIICSREGPAGRAGGPGAHLLLGGHHDAGLWMGIGRAGRAISSVPCVRSIDARFPRVAGEPRSAVIFWI